MTLDDLAAVAAQVAEAARLCQQAAATLARWGIEATGEVDDGRA